MKSRLFSLTLVLALLLGLVPAVGAQGDPTCLNLPAEDCEILLAAMANTDENLNSFAMTYDFEMALAGLAAMGPMMGTADASDLTVSSDGSGEFAMMLEAETFPPIAMSMTMNGAVTGPEGDSGSMSFVIVDGNFYMENPDEMGQWIGFAILDAMSASDFAALGLPFDMEGLMAGEMPEGELSPEDMLPDLGALGLPEDMDLSGLMETPGVVNYQRLDDADMMGQTMHVFSLDVDTAPLFNSPEFQTMMSEIMMSAGGETEDPNAAMMMGMIPMLLGGVSVTANVTQYIGADDMFIHGMSFDLNAALDLSALMGAAGGEGASEMQLPPITLDIHFEVMLDQLNESFEITAPADAMMIDPSEMDMDM